jgi:hypothetical protein
MVPRGWRIRAVLPFPKQPARGELARPLRLGGLTAAVVRDGQRPLACRRLADAEVDDVDAAVAAAQG